jgi:hypothetical protein
MLAALTALEQAVGRSGRTRETVPVRRPPNADKFLQVLAANPAPEVRIAVGLASVTDLRRLFLPIDQNGRWSPSPVIPGFTVRPLHQVLADVLIWRSRQGTVLPPGGIPVPAADLHDFAAGRLNDRKLELCLSACLALSWRNVSRQWGDTDGIIPVPTLGVLQTLAAGLTASDGLTLRLAPDWAALLVAGKVASVHREATVRLKQAGWEAVPIADGSVQDGPRIAAALLPRCAQPATKVLPLVARNLTKEQS